MAVTALQGETITLTTTFTNLSGFLENPTAPTVTIYPYGSDPRNSLTVIGDAIVALDTPTNVDLGIYTYDYVIPATAQVGTWYIVWEGTFGTDTVSGVTEFTVGPASGSTVGVSTGAPILIHNNVYLVTFTGITSADGDVLSDFTAWFTSEYTPMCTSYENIISLMSSVFSSMEEDAVNYLIFRASQEAECLTFGRGCVGMLGRGPAQTKYLKYAQQKYVECIVMKNAILNSLGGGGGKTPKSKKLGDLRVEWQDSSGSLSALATRISDDCDQWEQVLMSGGDLTPGMSIGMGWAVEGLCHPDRSPFGRQIRGKGIFSQTGSNGKLLVHGRTRYQHDQVGQPGRRVGVSFFERQGV